MEREMKFEQQMKKLQDIVEKLDESIRLYEEGLKLSKALKEQLDGFEKKIAELNGNE